MVRLAFPVEALCLNCIYGGIETSKVPTSEQLDVCLRAKKQCHTPRGPLTFRIFGGVNRVGLASFGGSSNVSCTSGGMIIGAAPTRDRLEEICEKGRDCPVAGFVKAGTRNSGMAMVLLRAIMF